MAEAHVNFDRIGASLDEHRTAVGHEIIAGALASCGVALPEVQLLDAGGGTGLFAEALIDQVGQIDIVDLSNAMLAVAHRRLTEAALTARVRFHHCDMEALPFTNNHFDGVMINQVLNHLESGANDKYPIHHRVLSEAFRVLRPGGVAVINCTTQIQKREGFWYYNLIPECLEAYLPRCIPDGALVDILQSVGFVFEGRTVPLDAVIMGARYFESMGPTERLWRQADSIWATATPGQLGAAVEAVQDMRREETLDGYVAEMDARRPRVGQVTFFRARKP